MYFANLTAEINTTLLEEKFLEKQLDLDLVDNVNVNSKLSQTMVKCTQKFRHRETRNIEPHFAQGNIVYRVTSLGSVSRLEMLGVHF